MSILLRQNLSDAGHMRRPLQRVLVGCFAALLVSGCAVNPVSEALSRAIALNGATLKGEYKEANLVGLVGLNELPPAQYGRFASNYLHLAGARPHTPERRYRIVPIVIRESDLFRHTFITGAYVPDHSPLLRESDVVEFRNLGIFDNLRHFADTREGNVILKVICYKDDPQYDECAKTKAPWKGYGKTAQVSGVAGTPWQPVASYGFTFTPRYDDEGNSLPDAPPIPARPFLPLPPEASR
ncbi:MAG: hypothetical protein H3C59_13250 [Burkholderiaceae bacterium]|nr:hypothetical protein [Burkholderiaceae bacterium]